MVGGDDAAVGGVGAERGDLGEEGAALVVLRVGWVADYLDDVEGAEEVEFSGQLGEGFEF